MIKTCLMSVLMLWGFSLFAASPEEIVTEAYQEVLGRKPDPSGMSEYRSKVIEKGWTAEDIKKALRKSDEYYERAITLAYQDGLGRKPDPEGMANYKRKMSKGWTEKEIRNDMRKSPEAKKK